MEKGVTKSPPTAAIVPAEATVKELMACLRERERLLPETEGAGSSEILERYLSAQSEEELDANLDSQLYPLQGDAAKGIPSLLSVPLRVHGVGWRNAGETFRNPKSTWIYAVLDVETQDGHHWPVSTGGDSVLAYFARRWANGWFPVDVTITKAENETRGGFKPLNVHLTTFATETPF
jgi:hypothetical protein